MSPTSGGTTSNTVLKQQCWTGERAAVLVFGIHSVATPDSLKTVHLRTAAQCHLAGCFSFPWCVAERWAAEPAIFDMHLQDRWRILPWSGPVAGQPRPAAHRRPLPGPPACGMKRRGGVCLRHSLFAVVGSHCNVGRWWLGFVTCRITASAELLAA